MVEIDSLVDIQINVLANTKSTWEESPFCLRLIKLKDCGACRLLRHNTMSLDPS